MSSPEHLFTISGNHHMGTLRLAGETLRPEDVFRVLDLERPRLEAVRDAVASSDLDRARDELFAYYRGRGGWQLLGPHSFGTNRDKWNSTEYASTVARDATELTFHAVDGYPPYRYGSDITEDLDWDLEPYGTDAYWSAGMQYFHAWSPYLATSYAATADETFARTWIGLVADWIAKNPLEPDRIGPGEEWLETGNGSWCYYELGTAMRCSQLLQALPYFLGSPHMTGELLATFLAALYNQCRLIVQMPYPWVTSNVAVAEGAALVNAAGAFPEFAEAGEWQAFALDRLDGAMEAQVRPDGTHGEQATGYHLWLAELYLRMLESLRAHGVQPSFAERTERMADVVLGLSFPDGSIAHVGDTDDLYDEVAVVAELAAAVFPTRRDLQALATGGSDAEWPGRLCFAFPEGGLYSIRSGWDERAIALVLSCGPPSVAEGFHAHADNGTFELYAFGRRVMRDPGIFTYGRGADREWFISTARHQTFTLDGRDSARAGRLRWLGDDAHVGLTVENAAYPGVVQRRTLFFMGGRCFVLVDDVLGDAHGALDLHFQLTPGPWLLDAEAKTARTNFTRGGNVLVWTDPAAPVELEQEPGRHARGWNQEEPLPAMRYRHQSSDAPARFVTVLAPFEGAVVPTLESIAVTGGIDDDALKVTLVVDGARLETQRPSLI